MVEGQVTVLQALQVAQHLVFGVMRVEHRGWDRMASLRSRASGRLPPRAVTLVSRADHVGLWRRRLSSSAAMSATVALLVDGDAERLAVHVAQVVAGGLGGRVDGCAARAGRPPAGYRRRLSEASSKPAWLEALGQQRGEAVDAGGDGAQAFRAVIHGVHAGHVGQQHLGRYRCWSWPSRGGCAARGFAVSCAGRSCRGRPSTRR